MKKLYFFYLLIFTVFSYSFEFNFHPATLSDSDYTAYKYQNDWQPTSVETTDLGVVTKTTIPPDGAWHYIPLNTLIQDAHYPENVEIVHNFGTNKTEIRVTNPPFDVTPAPIQVWYYTNEADKTKFSEMDSTAIQVYQDSSANKIMAPSLGYTNPWWYIIKRQTLTINPGTGEQSTYQEVMEQRSRVFNRSAVFYCVLESKLGMAHWKKLRMNVDLFYQKDPLPMNPNMRPPAISDEAEWKNPSDGLTNNPIWWQVPSSLTDNRYPPGQVPPSAQAATGDVGKTFSWNIRLWFHATNRERLASIAWLEHFTENYYMHRYLGTPGTEPVNQYYYQLTRRVIPQASLNLGDRLGTHEITLLPNNTTGLHLPASTNDDPAERLHELVFDLDSQLNPAPVTYPRKLLYGRFLIIIGQIYPYDRFKFKANTYSDNYLPSDYHPDYTTIKYSIPVLYNHILTEDIGTGVKNGAAVSTGFEVPPLTTSPNINDVTAEYNLVHFDVFLDKDQGGEKISTDSISPYYKWRAIQNFLSGTMENGSIVRPLQ